MILTKLIHLFKALYFDVLTWKMRKLEMTECVNKSISRSFNNCDDTYIINKNRFSHSLITNYYKTVIQRTSPKYQSCSFADVQECFEWHSLSISCKLNCLKRIQNEFDQNAYTYWQKLYSLICHHISHQLVTDYWIILV